MSDRSTTPGILIIGGGVSGLACGVTLAARGLPFTLHERAARVGGHARTEQVGAFRFDRGPHVLLGVPEELRELFSRLELPVRRCSCDSTIYFERFERLHVPAPLQANLGPLPLGTRLRCAAGFLHRSLRARRPPRDHRAQATNALGHGLVELFVEPYARKRLAMAMAEIHPEWTSRIPSPSMKQVLWDGLVTRRTRMGLDSSFSYPVSGGIERLPRALAQLVPPSATCVQDALVELDVERRVATFGTGAVRPFEAAVSSVPLNQLLDLVPDLPGSVRAARDELVWASTYVVNIGIDATPPPPRGIIRYPEPDIPFYRLSFPGTYATDCAPPGHDVVVAEVGYHATRRPMTAAEAEDRTVAALRRLGVLPDRASIVETEVVPIEVSHVVHGHRTPAALAHIGSWLAGHGIQLCGKYGEWREMLMPQSILSGVRAAERVAQHLRRDHV